MEIYTVAELKKAIRACSAVYARIGFLNNEDYFKITKETAMALVNAMPKDADPDMDYQVPHFGVLRNGELNLW